MRLGVRLPLLEASGDFWQTGNWRSRVTLRDSEIIMKVTAYFHTYLRLDAKLLMFESRITAVYRFMSFNCEKQVFINSSHRRANRERRVLTGSIVTCDREARVSGCDIFQRFACELHEYIRARSINITVTAPRQCCMPSCLHST